MIKPGAHVSLHVLSMLVICLGKIFRRCLMLHSYIKSLFLSTGAVETMIFQETYQLPPSSAYVVWEKQIASQAEGDERMKRMPARVYAERMVGDILNQRGGLTYHGQMASLAYWVVALAPCETPGARPGKLEIRPPLEEDGNSVCIVGHHSTSCLTDSSATSATEQLGTANENYLPIPFFPELDKPVPIFRAHRHRCHWYWRRCSRLCTMLPCL